MSICINKLWQHINSHYKYAVTFGTYLSWQFQPSNTSSQDRRGLLYPLSPEHRHLYSSWGSFGIEIVQDGYQCPPCRIQGHPPLEHTGLRIAMTKKELELAISRSRYCLPFTFSTVAAVGWSWGAFFGAADRVECIRGRLDEYTVFEANIYIGLRHHTLQLVPCTWYIKHLHCYFQQIAALVHKQAEDALMDVRIPIIIQVL